MKATPFLGTLHRLRSRLRLLFGRHRALRSAPRVVASAAPRLRAETPVSRTVASRPMPIAPEALNPALRDAPEPVDMPAVVAPVAAPVATPIVAKPAEAQPPAKTMRSLEEVRADLARLRESAKERHARAPVVPRRDISFEPTDFMDFAKPEPAPEPDEPFEQTAFLDFTTLKPRAQR
ncbi:hypothetical protein QTI33_19045 [Variovorax sp. J22P271]|uniref:hypothetical protein n=1 Tax=Variovorax davisae TaxID=3053515 RepID=UPI00257602A1|nr:hypothetical protein [Variovorax sp. J22P271]MDM0034239.1 hypothetical protein [Variovorax sp. J22P271]